MLFLLENGAIPKEDYSKVIQQIKSTYNGRDLPRSLTEIFKACASDAVTKVFCNYLSPNTISWLVNKVKEKANK